MTRHDWAVKVKERDGNRCAICGASGRLYAHHIEHEAVNWGRRTDIDNGVTLCGRCHILAHRGTFSPVGFGKLSEADGIRALEERAQSAAVRPLIVRIIEGDAEHTRDAIRRNSDQWRPDRRGWSISD
jgi:hypothetical protein